MATQVLSGPRGGLSACKVFAYDNAKNKTPLLRELDAKYKQDRYTTCYITDKDLVLYTTGYGERLIILPNEKKQGMPVPEKKLPRPTARGPIEDLFQAIRGGSPPVASFSYAAPFTEFILTGQLAMFAGAGKKLERDAAATKRTTVPSGLQLRYNCGDIEIAPEGATDESRSVQSV